MADNIQELKRKRLQFLSHLYETAEGQELAIVNMWELGEELELSRDETKRIVDYLTGEFLLRYVTIGGGISITHAGIVRVEDSYAELTELMKPVPPPRTVPQEPKEMNIPQVSEESTTVKILFLAANPRGTDPLRLDAEMRAIDQALRQSEFRDRFEVRQHWAVRVSDVQDCFLRHQPDVVHFSGHGSASNEIILEDESGGSQPVPVRVLGQLFSVPKDNIRCVVLNACHSDQQAEAIAEHIDCVVGMSKAIGDSAAISFAGAFHRALGYGRSVKTAFDLGCVQIDLESLDERDIPKLLAKKVDPKTVAFARGEIVSTGSSLSGLSPLENLLAELPTVRKLDFHHPDVQRWRRAVRLSLSQVFGEGSYYVVEYDKIPWRTSDRPEDADQQRAVYSRSCDSAEGLLKAAVGDLRRQVSYR